MVLYTKGEGLEENEENIIPDGDDVSSNSDDGTSSDGVDDSDADDQYEDIDTDELESGDDDDDDSDEEEESDEEEAKEGRPVVPKSIRVKGSITDISVHPSSYLLASATLRGLKASYVELYKNTPGEKAEQLIKLKASREEGRAISFSSDGSSVYYVSKDKTMRIIDTNTGSISRIIHQMHDALPHCMSVVDENLVATGDEDGSIKVWDLRHSDSIAVMSDTRFKPAGVTSLTVDDRHRLLFALSDNGVMATFNARQRKFLIDTEPFEFGLNCAVTMKDNSKLVVGTDEGLMHLYNWDEFAAPSDSFNAASGASIESIARVSEDMMFAACDDNIVRAISILPNKCWSEVGKFPDLPPQKVVTTYDDKFVIGQSFDGLVKFFDVDYATRDVELSDHDKSKKTWKVEKRLNQHRGTQKAKKRRQQALDAVDPAKRQARAQFFSDLDSEFKVPEVPDTSSDENSEDDENEKEEKPSCSS